MLESRLTRYSRGPLLTAVVLTATAGAALAASPFDGQYAGSRDVVGAAGGACPQTSHALITVSDGKLTYDHFGIPITGTVGADGTVNGSGDNTRYRPPKVETLKGKIAGDMLDATAQAPACTFHLTLKKR